MTTTARATLHATIAAEVEMLRRRLEELETEVETLRQIAKKMKEENT